MGCRFRLVYIFIQKYLLLSILPLVSSLTLIAPTFLFEKWDNNIASIIALL